MAIFKYTLPSGSQYQVTAPTGTTQVQADKIFYEQVAAGTFVGYNKGDSLTHPQEAINNFGISRLERGTAGVDDKTLLAVISGLPLVAPLPTTLAQVPVQNPIDQTNYIQVTSSPTGPVGLGPTGVGPLSSAQTQALMAQLASTTQSNIDAITQENGVGVYGFNCQQLEQAGLVKPGYCQRYCRIDPNTGTNPDNFVEFMQSPAPWTGLHGVTSVNDIIGQQDLQNTIQEKLFQQSYSQLVSNGTIVPPATAASTATANTGQVYNTAGTLATTSALALLSVGLNGGINGFLSGTSATALYNNVADTLGNVGNTISGAFSSLSSIKLGDIPADIQRLGADAVASYTSALSSLSTGAVGFDSSTLNNLTASTGAAVSQISGLAAGLTGGNVSGTIASISSTVSGDIGALITNGSKYGTELATAWADSATSTLTSIGSNLGSLASGISDQAQNAFNTAQTSLTSALDSLGKASQFSVNFSDFSLSSLVAGVQAAPAFTNTVDRSVLDAAVNRVIGTPLISPPVYEFPSPTTLGILEDINSAKSFLAQLQSTAQNIGSKIVNIV
jgi:hypothetical protein